MSNFNGQRSITRLYGTYICLFGCCTNVYVCVCMQCAANDHAPHANIRSNWNNLQFNEITMFVLMQEPTGRQFHFTKPNYSRKKWDGKYQQQSSNDFKWNSFAWWRKKPSYFHRYAFFPWVNSARVFLVIYSYRLRIISAVAV